MVSATMIFTACRGQACIGWIAVPAMILALTGCASTASKLEYDASLFPGGNWRVDCTDDHAKAQTTCFAGTFASSSTATSKAFQIIYINKIGPLLMVNNDFPGETPTVRVDDGPVLSDPSAIVEALRAGRTAYVVFYQWPRGEERMTVDVTGFSAAYRALLQRL